MHFGEGLRSERERRGIALEDISIGTRVSLRNLSALESERFGDLPGGVFNRSIVRSYARFCGMDEDAAVQAYTDALQAQGFKPEAENEDWVVFAENVRRSRTSPLPRQRLRWFGVAGMMVAVLLFTGVVFALLVQRGELHLPPKLQRQLHWKERGSYQAAPASSQPANSSDTPQ